MKTHIYDLIIFFNQKFGDRSG